MSSTDDRRKAYKYREAYLKHNNGLFGKYYVCAICHSLITKDEMEVDHIFPLNVLGPNHLINCVATCSECNRKKSDKISPIIIKEVIWKVIEEIIIGIKFIFSFVVNLMKTILLYPIKHSRTTKTKLIVIIIYILVLLLVLRRGSTNVAK